MNQVARRFIADLRKYPYTKVLQPNDPLWIEAVDSIEALLKRIYEQGADDPAAIERMDLITEALKQGGTLLERHERINNLLKEWRF